MPFVTVQAILAATTVQYAAGDAVGGVYELKGVVRSPGTGGEIRSVVLQEDTVQAASATVYFYTQSGAFTADNAAFGPSDSDNHNIVGFVPLTSYPATAPANNQVATAAGVGLAFQCPPGSTSLFCQVQTNGTPTYAVAGVRLAVTIYYE